MVDLFTAYLLNYESQANIYIYIYTYYAHTRDTYSSDSKEKRN